MKFQYWKAFGVSLKSLSYIDLVPYVHFKIKHNLYSNEHALNAWLIVYTYLGYHAIFLKINKYRYQLLYCNLQYGHAGTWLILVKNWRFLKKKKTRVSEIYSWSRGFAFRQKFMIKYKSSRFAPRDVYINIYFSKKTWSHLRCCTYTDYT